MNFHVERIFDQIRSEFISANMSILLKGGKVVNADSSVFADVLIKNGIIEEVGTNIAIDESVKVIDVTNKIIVPGRFYSLFLYSDAPRNSD